MIHNLICANIKHRKFQYTILFIILFIMCFSISASIILSKSMRNGLTSLKEKVGADIIVVPSGSSNISEDALFEGKPCTLTMSSDYIEDIKSIPSVTDISYRLYIATLPGKSCCSSETQLIATDIQNDFLLKSWVGNISLKSNDIIVGHDYKIRAGDTIKYFNRNFIVKKVLPETGSGYDSSCFISMTAANAIMKDPKYQNIFHNKTSDDSISMIFLRTSNMDETTYCLDMYYDKSDISWFSFNQKFDNMKNNIHDINVFISFFEVVLSIICFLAVFSLVAIMTYQRKNEIAAMLLMRFSWRNIFAVLWAEFMCVVCMSSLCGIITFSAIVILFKESLSKLFMMPFLISFLDMIYAFGIILICVIVISTFAIWLSFIKVRFISVSKLLKN